MLLELRRGLPETSMGPCSTGQDKFRLPLQREEKGDSAWLGMTAWGGGCSQAAFPAETRASANS
jgi:hypothetical protein